MKTITKPLNSQMLIAIMIIVATVLVIHSCTKDPLQEETLPGTEQHMSPEESSTIIPGQYIVMFARDVIPSTKFHAGMSYPERGEVVRAVADDVFTENNIRRPAEYLQLYSSTITGFATTLSRDELQRLSSDKRILLVEQDRVVTLSQGNKPGSPPGLNPQPPTQTTPWGITRVGGAVSYSGSAKAWIIDTGVDLTHPDLNVNTTISATFLGKNTTPNDQNGHGTHVAGTIAAINNSIGVIGVAPGAAVVSVRVLDRKGSGSLSGVIAGVDYVGAHGAAGDVANMSLSGSVSVTLDNAVLAASGSGIWFTIAAGNNSADANNYSPARVNGNYIYTVSAMASGDTWASFSNYGTPPVDFIAPGVSILSTWKDGGYNTINGTSMAAPHIAGIILVKNGQPGINSYVTGPANVLYPIGHTN